MADWIQIRVCVCVRFLPIHSGRQVRWTYQPGSHTGGRSHRISHPPSFCGACLNFSREKDSKIRIIYNICMYVCMVNIFRRVGINRGGWLPLRITSYQYSYQHSRPH